MSVEDIVLVYPDDFPAIVGINTFSFVKGNWVLFFPDFFFFFCSGAIFAIIAYSTAMSRCAIINTLVIFFFLNVSSHSKTIPCNLSFFLRFIRVFTKEEDQLI